MKILRDGGAILLAALALTACEDDAVSPEAFDESLLDDDVATVVADATVADVLDMMFVAGALGVAGPGDWVDETLSRSRTVTFYDADGQEMDRYDPLLTESVEIVTDVSGTRSTAWWSASVSHHRERTVSGMAGEETTRTWNGTGESDVDRTRFDDEAGDREYHMSSTSTTEDVVVAVPRWDNPWPLSGTITHHVVIEIVNGPDGDRTVERTVVVTFNGTQYVTMTVNGEEFEVDLAARDGHRPHRRHHG